MSVKERKVKTACGHKMPTQGRSARGKMEWSKNESVANHPAMGWTESIKCSGKILAIVHRRVRDEVEKKNENNNNKMKNIDK